MSVELLNTSHSSRSTHGTGRTDRTTSYFRTGRFKLAPVEPEVFQVPPLVHNTLGPIPRPCNPSSWIAESSIMCRLHIPVLGSLR